MTVPTIGRLVHYKLCQEDAEQIERQRAIHTTYSESMPGLIGPANRVTAHRTQQHRGNSVQEGDVFPMLITRVWGHAENSAVNGQVFLDGDDSIWVTSVHQHLPVHLAGAPQDEPRERSWWFPERV